MTAAIPDFGGRSLAADLRGLFARIAPRRRRQLALFLALQSVAAFSEVVSLGAVLPFLAALTDAGAPRLDPRLAAAAEYFGVSGDGSAVLLFAGLFAGAIIVANILRFATLLVQHRLGAAIGTDFGSALFDAALRRPLGFFSRTNSSHLIGNATNELASLLVTIQNILALVSQSLVALAIGVTLLLYDPLLTLGLALLVCVSFALVTLAVRRRLYANSATISVRYRDMVRALQEGFGGIRFIALHGRQEIFVRAYEDADRDYRRKSADNMVARQAPRFVIESVGVAAISLLAVSFLAQRRELSDIVPLLGFLALGCYRLLPSVQQIYAAAIVVMGHRSAIRRTMDALEGARPAAPDATRPPPPLVLAHEISFRDVSFTHPGESAGGAPTLRDIDLTIPARSVVAIVGATGSGKTTLGDLMLGLLAPDAGTIEIDGQPLSAELVPRWQRGVAQVPQSVFLTDASIAENIAFGCARADIDMARVRDAARQAQIADFIEGLAHGYDHIAGERGARLSGGQAQRIGIARALYLRPSFILLDEATSALDLETEHALMEAIASLRNRVTIALIAHRLSTIAAADRIFVLDNGRLAASGTYDELLDRCEPFRILARNAAAR